MGIYKRVNKVYKKYSHKIINKVKNYSLDRLIMSEYARENVNIIPMTLMSVIIRSIFNFLIIYKLTTNHRILNFIISVISNVLLTLLTPMFYGIIKYQEEDVKMFTNVIINNLWGTDGWTYFYTWKNRILASTGLIIIILLYFIEINSSMIQKFIFNLLLSGFIVDKLNDKIEQLTFNNKHLNDKNEKSKIKELKIKELKIKELKIEKLQILDVNRIDVSVKPLQAKYIDISYKLDENIIKSYHPLQ